MDLANVLKILCLIWLARFTLHSLRNLYLARKWKTAPLHAKRSLANFLYYTTRHYLKLKTEGSFLDHLAEQYVRLGAETYKALTLTDVLIFTQNPTNIKAMLATQFEEFGIGIRHSAYSPLLGKGVFVAEGEHWKHSRLMLRPQFSREQVGHVQIIEPHLQTLFEQIKGFKGREFNIQLLFHRLTLDIASEFLFGASVHSLRDPSIGFHGMDEQVLKNQRFQEDITFLLRYMSMRALLMKLSFVANSSEFRTRVKSAQQYVQQFVEGALALSDAEVEAKSRESYTLLYELAKSTKDPVAIRDELLNILLAGRSTTASLLSWTFFELARNDQIYKKLRQEVLQAFGDGSTAELRELITFESLKKCTYLRYVLNETLRMYPPVAQNLRQARKNTTLPKGGGPDGEERILVTKKQIVVFQLYALHRNPAYFGEDANVYNPDRWVNLAKIGWAFMPFGTGPRICLGQQFALTEALYVAVRILQTFAQIELHLKFYPPRKAATTVLENMDGVHIALNV